MVLVSVRNLVGLYLGLLLEVVNLLSCAILNCSLTACTYKCIMSLHSEALSRLNAVIRHPNATHSENVMAYDNAVSALGKICQFHRDSIDAAQVLYLFYTDLLPDTLREFLFFISNFNMLNYSTDSLLCPNVILITVIAHLTWQIVPMWLNCLPIKGDQIEAKVVHEQFCSMVER